MHAANRYLNFRLRFRNVIVLGIDTLVAVMAVYAAIWLRTGGAVPPSAMLQSLNSAAPVIAAMGIAVHILLGQQGVSWRYASVRDLPRILLFATILTLGMVLLLSTYDLGSWRPRSLPVLYWMLLVIGCMTPRLIRRLIAEFMRGSIFPVRSVQLDADTEQHVLIAGNSDRMELVLRSLEERRVDTGSPVGVLLEDGRKRWSRMRSLPVLGMPMDLEAVVSNQRAKGKSITRLVIAEPHDRLRVAPYLQMVATAETLGVAVSCLPSLKSYVAAPGSRTTGAKKNEQALQQVNLADLLGRPQNVLDCQIVRSSIEGRRVLVTGAGGTIGKELTRQIASFDPAQIILVEASEIALYEVDREMGNDFPEIERSAILCCIRQRRQLMEVFAQFMPEVVFHAAALKHVPIVEKHPCAGVLTNVVGTRNVVDAAYRYGAHTMVQVSTDKAINPVGLMGATKRLGELYCQARDLQSAGRKNAPRFLTVRFGNVLGSSGSLIPLFEKQLAAGGPLTVTHPDIERFFMTVQEAVQLVLQASARSENVERGRIFVLDMGKPVKILDVARRMIRLSGKVPDKDIKIKFVGLRPGEKLFEELFSDNEQQLPSVLEGIFEAEPDGVPLSALKDIFTRLERYSIEADDWAVRDLVFRVLETGENALQPLPGDYVMQDHQPGPQQPFFFADNGLVEGYGASLDRRRGAKLAEAGSAP